MKMIDPQRYTGPFRELATSIRELQDRWAAEDAEDAAELEAPDVTPDTPGTGEGQGNDAETGTGPGTGATEE